VVGVRLLLVHQAFPPEAFGGSEAYTFALGRELARGHEVAVLHPSADPARPDYDVRESTRDAVRVFSLNSRLHKAGGFESYRDPRAAAAAARLMDEWQPEIVHAGNLAGLSTGLIWEARRRGIAVVLTLHDFWSVCPLGQLLNLQLEVCPGPTPRRCLGCVGEQVTSRSAALRTAGRAMPWASGIGRVLSRAGTSGERRIAGRLEEMQEVLRAADVLISPSRFLRDRLVALGAPEAQVLDYGHEPLARPPRRSDPHGRVRFGFVGSAIPSKGVHVLAEAFGHIDHGRAALEIHGAFTPYHGDTSYEARVRQVLGPGAEAVLRGSFPRDRLGDVLAGLDVLVVPSIWEENSPLAIQEAFLAGIPVVASRHGGQAEKIRDGLDGLLFQPGDAADLARVMRRFLDEPPLASRLVQARPHVPTMGEHVAALEPLYATARRRLRQRVGRVGVVVLDCGRPDDTAAAVHSALDATVSPEILVVENGPGAEPVLPPRVQLLRLPQNRGYAAGMNAGLEALRASGCDRVLLLNNDAILEPGALRQLAEALEDETLAAVGPTIRRAADGRVESQGAELDLRWGRYRLLGHGAAADSTHARRRVEVLSGAALMVRLSAFDRVGPLDEEYFHSFEDADWCVRARAAGFDLAVVTGAVVVHAGARTLGAASPDRAYYAARNHLRAVERLRPLSPPARWIRQAVIVARNLAFALKQREIPRGRALAAVVQGGRDFGRGRFGRRPVVPAGRRPG
jgi:GT2 family glycosyltransferase/glycosyltransferase involved in cell wall biosynthesis